jgi:vitamin B12/bleomycin/antimicrobial peptide transport system ATP-binding/permease protein
MSAHTAPLNRQTALRFVRAIRDLLTSEVRRQAIGLLLLLLVFALSVSGLNVVNSYVGRDFMTAIADRDMSGFVRLAILYVGVFAASTAAAVLYRFCEERLGLLWRSWLTKRVTLRRQPSFTTQFWKSTPTLHGTGSRGERADGRSTYS